MIQHSIPKQYHMDERVYDAYKIDNLVTSKTHWHSHFLVSLYTSGTGTQIVNGVRHEICRGCITMLSPLDFHSNIINEKELASVCTVKFSDKIFYQRLGNYCTFLDFPIIHILSEEDYATAETIFSLLMIEQAKEDVWGSELFAETLIEQLIILALRTKERNRTAIASKVMRKALMYIHYNFKTDFRVDDVAKYVGYSSNYFSTQFKKEIGISFQHYLCNLRLDFGRNLLRYSDLSITEVCLESGFNTLAHFSKTFKQRFGVSPEQCRQNVNIMIK